ncbi:MAG TPA: HmuY family protein [Chitinophagaceae bacterium]
MKNRIIYGAVFMTLILAACSKKDNTVVLPETVKTKSMTVNFSSSSSFTFFSFRDTTVIANSDSASSKWDFALRLTTFLVNSNASGPGNAGVILQDGIYDNVSVAPSAGYAYDTTSSQKAIKDGSWYDYNPTTHSFVPKAGKVFIFRTADGHYAKMELLSVSYEPFTGPVPVRLIYNFRYTYQPNNSYTF